MFLQITAYLTYITVNAFEKINDLKANETVQKTVFYSLHDVQNYIERLIFLEKILAIKFHDNKMAFHFRVVNAPTHFTARS